MKNSPFFEHFHIDDFSSTPKYQQLANAVIQAVRDEVLKESDPLPSINELSFEYALSRDTIEKGYRQLKNLGVLGSHPGKGYFIKSVQVEAQTRIFLLFNKLSEHKKIIYDSFVSALGDGAAIDFYIYNNDFSLFKKLITQRKQDYSFFVIIPHFLDVDENAAEILNALPKEKLILLDKLIPGVTPEFGAVYENFEKDIYGALKQALPALRKYKTIKITFPEYTYHPREIIRGLEKFCLDHGFSSSVVNDIEEDSIQRGDVYLNLVEKDLVALIEKILSFNLIVGEDVGLISYNEIPLKKLILNGITTISTDFKLMGETAARLIMNHSKEHIEIPFHLTLRKSL